MKEVFIPFVRNTIVITDSNILATYINVINTCDFEVLISCFVIRAKDNNAWGYLMTDISVKSNGNFNIFASCAKVAQKFWYCPILRLRITTREVQYSFGIQYADKA